MRGFALGLSLSVAFIVGTIAAPLLVSSSSAQQPEARELRRWDQRCLWVRSENQDAFLIELNETGVRWGREAWELAEIYGDQRSAAIVCFKRPL